MNQFYIYRERRTFSHRNWLTHLSVCLNKISISIPIFHSRKTCSTDKWAKLQFQSAQLKDVYVQFDFVEKWRWIDRMPCIANRSMASVLWRKVALPHGIYENLLRYTYTHERSATWWTMKIVQNSCVWFKMNEFVALFRWLKANMITWSHASIEHKA